MNQPDAQTLVEIRLPSDNAIDAVRQIVEICQPSSVMQWGPDGSDAFIMEVLISTLSHALNEDFLVSRLRRLHEAEPWALTIHRLAEISEQDVARWFELTNTTQPKRNPQRLADLIRANFSHVRDEDDWRIEAIFDRSDGSSVDAFKWLATFPVFERDPLRKKSALILQRLYLQGYLPQDRYADLPFALDRHILRLFLRLGWIRARTDALSIKVTRRFVLSAEEDTALRTNARMVMSNLAERSGIPNAYLNYALWQFARSYCSRRNPGCLSIQPTLLGIKAELAPDGGSACIMAAWCSSFHTNTVLTTLDPVHRGDLY